MGVSTWRNLADDPAVITSASPKDKSPQSSWENKRTQCSEALMILALIPWHALLGLDFQIPAANLCPGSSVLAVSFGDTKGLRNYFNSCSWSVPICRR